MRLEVRGLRYAYALAEVLRGVSFDAEAGEIIAVLGPNGVGKSTLFQCLLGFLRPKAGSVAYNGRDLSALSQRERAREVAYIPQNAAPVFDYTVLDMVTMGTASSLGLLRMPGTEQRDKALETLESLGIGHLAQRGCNRISGGERQLMLLARALVQEAGVLLMDEPTASLDYGNSFRVMERIRALGRAGYTVLFSTHEPNQAFRYASRVLALREGAILADGRPEDVLTEAALQALYRIPVAVRGVEVAGKEYRLSVPYENEEDEA